MNEAGVSSACFYPQETEKAIEKLISYQIPLCEIFLNSPSELRPEFMGALKQKTEQNQLRVVSFHPFTSFMESFFLFSSL